MDYDIGTIGRVVVARARDGEDIYAGIEDIARRENLRSAVVLAVGGMRKGKLVVGPQQPTGPIEPTWAEFDDAREILAVGTIFWDEADPVLHLHAGVGRGEKTLVGCPRGGASVFCVLEVILLEVSGLDASRTVEPGLALKLLDLAGGKTTD